MNSVKKFCVDPTKCLGMMIFASCVIHALFLINPAGGGGGAGVYMNSMKTRITTSDFSRIDLMWDEVEPRVKIRSEAGDIPNLFRRKLRKKKEIEKPAEEEIKPEANADAAQIGLSSDFADADGYMFADLADRKPVPVIDFDLEEYFPRAARSANITRSAVIVEIQVNANGSTGKHRILSADAGYGFDKAAAKVVSRMRFRPGRVKGKPVKMLVRLPIVFSLEN